MKSNGQKRIDYAKENLEEAAITFSKIVSMFASEQPKVLAARLELFDCAIKYTVAVVSGGKK